MSCNILIVCFLTFDTAPTIVPILLMTLFSHSFITASSFAIVGMISEKYHTKNYMQITGILKFSPKLAFIWLVNIFLLGSIPISLVFISEVYFILSIGFSEQTIIIFFILIIYSLIFIKLLMIFLYVISGATSKKTIISDITLKEIFLFSIFTIPLFIFTLFLTPALTALSVASQNHYYIIFYEHSLPIECKIIQPPKSANLLQHWLNFLQICAQNKPSSFTSLEIFRSTEPNPDIFTSHITKCFIDSVSGIERSFIRPNIYLSSAYQLEFSDDKFQIKEVSIIDVGDTDLAFGCVVG